MNTRILVADGGVRASGLVLLAISLIGLVLSVTGFFSVTSSSDVNLAGFVSLALLLSYFFLSYFYHKTLYLISSTYVLALSVFHLVLVYQEIFGLVDIRVTWSEYFMPYIVKAVWCVDIALASFFIGFSAIALLSRRKVMDSFVAKNSRRKAYMLGQWSSYGLLLASVIFFVMALYSYGNLLEYSRHEIFRSNADSRGFGLFMMVFPGAVTLFFISATNKKNKLISAALVLFAVLLFLFSGYRSAALFPLLAGIILWVKKGNKLPIYMAAGVTAAVLFAISFFGILRSMGAYEEIGSQELEKSYQQVSIMEGVLGLGGTVGLLAHTLDFVPDEEPYRMGRTYGAAILAGIPNIGLKINESKSREAMKDELKADSEAVVNMVPSDWMTLKILPYHYDLGQGVGFSAIAEPYLNFGIFGIIVYFILLGGVLGKLDLLKISYHPKAMIFLAAMYWPLIRTVRNDFNNFTKPFFFILIIFVVWWAYSALFLNKKFKT